MCWPQGRVYTINHKRDAAGAKAKRRATAEEDDEEAVDDTEALPPQVWPAFVDANRSSHCKPTWQCLVSPTLQMPGPAEVDCIPSV